MSLETDIKQSEFKSEYNKAIVNLIYTFNWLDYQHKNFFKQYGLTSQQYNILRILRGQHPQPCTINLLRERMLDKMCDASRIVERLRLKDLIVRKISFSDRRAVDIIISDKGLEILSQIDGPIKKFEDTIAGLSPEEAKYLNDLLDKFREKKN